MTGIPIGHTLASIASSIASIALTSLIGGCGGWPRVRGIPNRELTPVDRVQQRCLHGAENLQLSHGNELLHCCNLTWREGRFHASTGRNIMG